MDTTRGGRRHGGLIDEIRDHDAELLNEVVLPLMNVSRKMVNGKLNPYEPHQSQFFMTSAGTKATFAYEKCLEVFSRSIINPKDYFCWGCDYRVPMMHGLLDKSYVNDIKTSSTFNEESFAREYLGVWTGGSTESWFQYDKLQRYRKLLNPETHEKIRDSNNQFYLLSVDVGRLSCQTVVSVFKVNIRANGFFMSLVNMYVLGTTSERKHFELQALDLKKIINDFNPREVVIDGNGIGVGLLDFMIKPTIDLESGITYPAIGCINDDDYIKIQPRDCNKLIYVIKANTTLNSQIHSNCYNQIFSGHVQFLVKEQEAKVKLMSTKVGQKMDTLSRQKRLMPHEMTTKLFEEMANLRLKQNSGLTINLEQINTRHTKDKFSSFEYGLWRIKELEEEYQKKNRKRGRKRKLIFYSGG